MESLLHPAVVQLDEEHEGGKELNITESSKEPDVVLDPSFQPPHHLTSLIFFLLGAGILVPFNSFIIAVDYFRLIYPDIWVEFLFPFLYMAFNTTSMVPLVMYGKKFSFSARLYVGFASFAVIMLVVPFIDLQASKKSSIYFTLVGIVLAGIMDSVAQGSLYGLAALFPPEYTASVQSGNGMAGLIVSLLRIGTKVIQPETEEGVKASSMIFFVVGGMYMFFCMGCYGVLRRQNFTNYMLTTSQQGEDRDSKTWRKDNKISFRSIMGSLWQHSVIVFLIFFIALMLFPGVTSMIQSTTWNMSHDWFTILLMGVFNLGDLIAKTIPRWYRTSSEKPLWVITLLRLLFIPLFILCINPRVFNHDSVAVVFVALFGLSGGFVGSMAMSMGPQKVLLNEQEVAGTIMVFSLIFGLLIGSMFAFAFVPLGTT